MGEGLYTYKEFIISHVGGYFLVYVNHEQRVVGNFIYKGEDISETKDIIDKLVISNMKDNTNNYLQ